MNYKIIKINFMLATMFNFWGCTTHRMRVRPNEVTDCTKTVKTTRNRITGSEETTTTITPCERTDCPAKKHGFSDSPKEKEKEKEKNN